MGRRRKRPPETAVWIDGFNLLHRWPPTRGLMQGHDLSSALQTALRRLECALGSRARQVRVYLDGFCEGVRADRLRLVWAGGGQSADAALEAALEGVAAPETVSVVTSDRRLAARLRTLRARVQTVEAFAQGLHPPPAARQGAPVDRMGAQEKPCRPTRTEVEALLEVFGEVDDLEDEEG